VTTVEGVTAALAAAAAKSGCKTEAEKKCWAKRAFVYVPSGSIVRSGAVPTPAPHVPDTKQLQTLNACTLVDPTSVPYTKRHGGYCEQAYTPDRRCLLMN